MVKEWVIEWFKDNGNVQGELDLYVNFFDEGLIDSFGFINLIADCEEHFSITFDDDDFDGQEMLTVEGLIKHIGAKL